MRTLTLTNEHSDRIEALMKKFMGATYAYQERDEETITYETENQEEEIPLKHNWLYITMVLLPQYIGDWHLDANWMVTHMTAKKFKHPIDYLYEKYIDEEK